MTIVSGYITTITGGPSNTLSVSVRADRTRPSASGVTTAEPQIVSWDPAAGELIFTAEPGAAVINLSMGSRMESIPISVPDAENATLEEVMSEKFIIPPPVVNRGLDLIEGARDEALGQVDGAVDEAIGTRLDAKADVSTVRDLAAVTTGFTGVARRNSSRIRELVSELATKADQAGVDAALAGKADTGTVGELSALVVSTLGVGRRNADRIKQLAAGETNHPDLTEVLATKADTSTLDTRVPTGGIPGQLLMATPTGGRWSWAGRFPSGYHDKY